MWPRWLGVPHEVGPIPSLKPRFPQQEDDNSCSSRFFSCFQTDRPVGTPYSLQQISPMLRKMPVRAKRPRERRTVELGVPVLSLTVDRSFLSFRACRNVRRYLAEWNFSPQHFPSPTEKSQPHDI
jgi:hypothetical protein